jgi:hypothetical protein
MKTTLIFFIAFLSVTELLAGAKPLNVVKATDGFLVLRFDKRMIGGTLEILDANGAMIATVKVEHKRMIVDFFSEPDGTYHISFKKDDVSMNFDFEVRSPKRAITEILPEDARMEIY